MKLLFPVLLLVFSISVNAQIADLAENISPLLIGEMMPDGNLSDAEGNATSYLELIKEKPTITMIYRGGWCPYCTNNLAEVGDIEDQLTELGYQLVAICPDAPDFLNTASQKEELKVKLLSDASGSLMKDMGILFQAPVRYAERLNRVSDGGNDGFLPVPSVFITGTDGEILFEYVNPNYRKRISASLLLNAAIALKTEWEGEE
ncbi:MAG: AhpC/TSA family protein [Saprospiraceae bacterium]|nr:AhpC/TSA family protein [Saprospiraceae bacterium]